MPTHRLVSPLTLPRKLFRKYLPDAQAVRANRLVAPFARWLTHPNLWHLNRRSVSGAVAIGLFSGLVPGPLQMLSALVLSIALRRNLPVALLLTFYTNPFTIVPLYLLAYGYGRLLMGAKNEARVEPFEVDWSDLAGSMAGLLDWMLGLGKPLAVGLVALAVSLAIAGYFAVQLGWRLHVAAAWRRRQKRRRAR